MQENAADEIGAELASPSTPALSQAAVWASKLAGRITDPVTGIALPASEPARNILTGTLVLIAEAIDSGKLPPETPQTVWDADNVPRPMPAAELRELLLRYGALWQAMHAEFAP